MQYGTAEKISSMVSRIDLGLPGRFMMSALPRIPAVCRDRMAVGTCLREMVRILSPKPGSSLVHTASVASGVTSLGAGPVPPVVTTKLHFELSTCSELLSMMCVYFVRLGFEC